MSRLIDADALIEKYGDWYTEEGSEEGYIGTIKGLVDEQPTIEPDRKKGRWMWSSDEYGESWICSECMAEYSDFEGFKDEAKFCPNCGADMRG